MSVGRNSRKKGRKRRRQQKFTALPFPTQDFCQGEPATLLSLSHVRCFFPPCQFWGSGTHENRIGRGGGRKRGDYKARKGVEEKKKISPPPSLSTTSANVTASKRALRPRKCHGKKVSPQKHIAGVKKMRHSIF